MNFQVRHVQSLEHDPIVKETLLTNITVSEPEPSEPKQFLATLTLA